MDWETIFQIVLIIVVVLICIKVVLETQSATKASAYLLLIILVPFVGIILYVFFGRSQKKTSLYAKKFDLDSNRKGRVAKLLRDNLMEFKAEFANPFSQFKGVANMLINDISSVPTATNDIKLYNSGNEKFDDLIPAIRTAKHHVHVQYYIFKDDEIATQVAQAMMDKATEGVTVRLLYDDFGSKGLNNKLIRKMKDHGIELHPFYEVKFIALADRLNYRNHRKIVVIDGREAYTGGVNVGDEYVNREDRNFWRDTHVRIRGEAVWGLQTVFLNDWNFCVEQEVAPDQELFPQHFPELGDATTWIQIAASGPDSQNPSILYAYLEAIYGAREHVRITTPYFIPSQSLIEALHSAVLRGVKVELIVPEKSDSFITNYAARSFYQNLLDVGVDVYLYQKGFVHSKIMTCDGCFSTVGTANLDHRSFELNFEVNALVYDEDFNRQLSEAFDEDINDCRQLDAEEWANRNKFVILFEKIIRLGGPLL